jgi:hypothetical protein
MQGATKKTSGRSNSNNRSSSLFLDVIAWFSSGGATFPPFLASVLSTEWVGDLFLFDLLERCAEAEHPLVSIVEPLGPERKRNLNYRSQVSLTDTGGRVLDGKADHVTCNGIDRWIGGVHLSGKRVPWRWDDHRQRIVSAT